VKNLVSLGLRHENQKLFILDQTLLPHKEQWIECHTPLEMIALIQRLAVRGAPLIGVAASVALARFAENGATSEQVLEAAHALRAARPTAVNLMHAIDEVALNSRDLSVQGIVQRTEALFDEDVSLCHEMAELGSGLISDGDHILTHCNAGALATVGAGTALGVITRAHEKGKKIHVYVDETRPLLQGARLTVWELQRAGVPCTLICDNMAGFLMQRGKIHKIFVGADRIARNGDAANKIGTYSVAVLAKAHQVPFYVVAPHTTIDLKCENGSEIPIEQRDSQEVRTDKAPLDCNVTNPAFDVTPAHYITGIITTRSGDSEKYSAMVWAPGGKPLANSF